MIVQGMLNSNVTRMHQRALGVKYWLSCWNLRYLRFEVKRQAAHSIDELHFDCFHLADRLKTFARQSAGAGLLKQEK